MIKEREYFLGFSVFPEIGPVRFRLLLNYFGSAKKAWNVTETDLININFNSKITARFLNFRDKFHHEVFIDNLYRKNIGFICSIDNDYPTLLREISDLPYVLYYRGNKNLLTINYLNIAVVGTRKMTLYGKKSTHKIINGFTGTKTIIVSGLAQGIDTIAHELAIENRLATIAVLGSGIDKIYPPVNYDLYWKIVKSSGLILSEYPPGFSPNKASFPMRNRIIAGLSRAVIVIEGKKTSGALITAKYALDYGRDVFAVPGSINNPFSEGPNYLIKNGANIISDARDIVDFFQ